MNSEMKEIALTTAILALLFFGVPFTAHLTGSTFGAKCEAFVGEADPVEFQLCLMSISKGEVETRRYLEELRGKRGHHDER